MNDLISRKALIESFPQCRGTRDAFAKHIQFAPTIEAEPVKWIPVTERLPEESDADDAMGVYAVHKRSLKRYWHFASVKDNPFDFTYWMPIPQPPEDGERSKA